MSRLFGTDGVRGVANVDLTADLVYRLGRAAAYVLAGELDHRPRFLVGRDTRISGDLLAAALTAGFTSAGADVYDGAVLTTPAVAHLVKAEQFDCGAMISASHNPFEFNGIKLFSASGYKLPDELEEEIECEMSTGAGRQAVGDSLGRRFDYPEGRPAYTAWLKETMGLDLTGRYLALDCANGSAATVAPELFRSLGARIEVIGADPDGLNINAGCGSTHLEKLQALVSEKGCDLGIAYDGDADRFLAVDHEGETVDGDRIMAVIGRDMAVSGRLNDRTVVATVMSNLGFAHYCDANGLKLVRTKVGDRYVLEEMLEKGYNLGGEQSGHVILLDQATTGDGILTSLRLLHALEASGQDLAAALAGFRSCPQVLKQVSVTDNAMKGQIMADEDVLAHVAREEAELGSSGRVLLRPSGTEPVIRVMFEGEDMEDIHRRCDALVELISGKVMQRMAGR